MSSIQSTISTNNIVSINEKVISDSVQGVALTPTVLTKNPLMITNTVIEFISSTEVGNYFGMESVEYKLAKIYFTGPKNFQKIPEKIAFYRVVDSTAISSFFIGSSLPTLESLQALATQKYEFIVNATDPTGAMTQYLIKDIVIGTAATSYSALATYLQQQINAVVHTQSSTSLEIIVEYNKNMNCFAFTNGLLTGGNSSIIGCTDPITPTSENLNGASILGIKIPTYISKGSDIVSPNDMINNIVSKNSNFSSFIASYAMDDSYTVQIAQAINSLEENYVFFAQTTDSSALVKNDTTSIRQKFIELGLNNCVPFWGSIYNNMFSASIAPSMDLVNSNLISWLFQYQDGLVADITDDSQFNTLIANGYNFYGLYSNKSPNNYNFYYPDNITGIYNRIDACFGSIWLKDRLQNTLMTFLLSVNKVSYNITGYSLIYSVLQEVILECINNSIISIGISLSPQQILELTQEFGQDISNSLEQNGYFIQVLDPGATVRPQGGSPIIKIAYTYSGGVQKFVLTNIQVQ